MLELKTIEWRARVDRHPFNPRLTIFNARTSLKFNMPRRGFKRGNPLGVTLE
jgi:hypothetical protein